MTSYPWASQLTKHNLVVLQSCNTAGSNGSFLGMAETAQLSGAGTTIGFKDLVYFPVNCPNCDSTGIRWARVFWDNLGAGYTYTTATIRATNSLSGGYGYGSYRILTNPGAPQRLRPSQYYVWPAGGIGAAQATGGTYAETGTGNENAAWESHLIDWLGTEPSLDGIWERTADGTRIETYRPGLGLFEIEPESGQITEAIFESDTTDGPTLVDADKAVDIASDFAIDHRHDIGRLDLRSVDFADHGSFSEYRVTWQERSGPAWLPTRTTIGINATTGRVLYFAHDPTQAAIDTRSAVTEGAAAESALNLLDGPNWRPRSRPSLEVVVEHDGTQRLAWIHEVSRERIGVGSPEAVVVWTDAHTGTSMIHDRS